MALAHIQDTVTKKIKAIAAHFTRKYLYIKARKKHTQPI